MLDLCVTFSHKSIMLVILWRTNNYILTALCSCAVIVSFFQQAFTEKLLESIFLGLEISSPS
jgi:hypothetical protein